MNSSYHKFVEQNQSKIMKKESPTNMFIHETEVYLDRTEEISRKREKCDKAEKFAYTTLKVSRRYTLLNKRDYICKNI